MKTMDLNEIDGKLRGMKPAGYQLTLVYDMSTTGSRGVKTRTMQFDSEEAAQKEASRYHIGEYDEVDGVPTKIHDIMVTSTFVKNLPEYCEK